jgi:hypothetical protein
LIWKALFSVLGAASFVFILHGYGFAHLGADIEGLGWWVLPLGLSFAPVAFLYGVAWFLVTPQLSLRYLPSMLPLSAISLGWNNLSPFVKVLGEPMRVVLIERWIPRKAALASVVLYNLVHILGTLIAFILGAALILALFPVSHTIRMAFSAVGLLAFLLLFGIYFLPYFSLRAGRRRQAGRKPSFFQKASFWLRWSFSRMRIFGRLHPWRFWSAVGVETIVRFVEGITFYVAFRALAAPISVLQASLLDVGRALLDNAFFFIPYQVGSREAGILLLSKSVLGIGEASVVSATVFYRLVEILWMGIGYLLWLQRSSSAKLST